MWLTEQKPDQGRESNPLLSQKEDAPILSQKEDAPVLLPRKMHLSNILNREVKNHDYNKWKQY